MDDAKKKKKAEKFKESWGMHRLLSVLCEEMQGDLRISNMEDKNGWKKKKVNERKMSSRVTCQRQVDRKFLSQGSWMSSYCINIIQHQRKGRKGSREIKTIIRSLFLGQRCLWWLQ